MNKIIEGDIVFRKNKPRIKGRVLEIWKREDYCRQIPNTYNRYRMIKGGLVARVEWENNYTSTIKVSSLVKVDSIEKKERNTNNINEQKTLI